jgi:hypothetical protein
MVIIPTIDIAGCDSAMGLRGDSLLGIVLIKKLLSRDLAI